MPTAVPSDVKCFKPLLVDTDGTSPSGGGVSPVQVADFVVGDIFPRLEANQSGDIDVDHVDQNQKLFIKLDSTGTAPDGSVQDLKLFGENWLGVPPGAGVISFLPASTSDDSTKSVQVWFQGGGPTVPPTESVQLNGTTPVAGIQIMSRVFRLKMVDSLTGLLQETATDDIEVFVDGVKIGIIPAGFTWATGEMEMAMEPTVDSTSQIANRTIDAAAFLGLTYSRPNSIANALPFASGEVPANRFDAQENQGVWLRQTIQPGMAAEPQINFSIKWAGGAAL